MSKRIACMNLHYALLEGSGDFPIDMLRWDECYPARETDSSAIQSTGKRYVIVSKRGGQFTISRWRSFCWVALGVHSFLDFLVQDVERRKAAASRGGSAGGRVVTLKCSKCGCVYEEHSGHMAGVALLNPKKSVCRDCRAELKKDQAWEDLGHKLRGKQEDES